MTKNTCSIFCRSRSNRFQARIDDLVGLADQFSEPPRTQLMQHIASLHEEAEMADQLLDILNDSSSGLWVNMDITRRWLVTLSVTNAITIILLLVW